MVVSATASGGRSRKPLHLSKQGLSPRRVDLVELMQNINFGRIERLSIQDGQPILDPRPLIVREHKFAGENGPRPELAVDDFLLKKQVIGLFSFFDEERNGVIDLLEIKNGLPFRMLVAEVAA